MTDFIKQILCFLIVICGGLSSHLHAKESRLNVFVSIPPQSFLAEKISGAQAQISVLADKGQDPHTFSPTPKQILSLGGADIYFTIGIPFEKQVVAKIQDSTARTRIVDSTIGIKKRKMDDHDPEGSHADDNVHAGEPDPHVWLAPPLLKIIAHNMTEAFIAADPAGETLYRSNYLSLIGDIDAMHKRVSLQLAPYRSETIFVYHPAFGYLADSYGLKQKAVEISGKSPSVKELTRLIKQAQRENIRIIFVQPQFDQKTARAIAAAIDGAVVPLDSLAKNLLQSIAGMATEIEHSLKR